MERLTDQASVSVDFVDADHLLFTFNNKKLFKRHPECPPADGDRLVHAAVLEISTSKVVKEVDWYLHDHSRYLWSLGNGHFLLRKLNSLYIVDSSLQETVLPIFPADLLWVSVTPDGKQIVIESTDEENPGKVAGVKSETKNIAPKYQIQFVDANSLTIVRTLKVNQIVNLDATSTGFADVIQKDNLWLARFGPSLPERQNLARVRSRCIPELIYSSNNSVLNRTLSFDRQ